MSKPFLTENAILRPRLLTVIAAAMLSFLAPSLLLPSSGNAAIFPEDQKILIVYYSRSGNTELMAQNIHKMVGGDIVKLETVQPYPEQYRATTKQAKEELATNFYPPLKNTVNDVRAYDLIFVGSPSWWGTFASPVRGFLAQNDFSGKKLVPFITHGGSAMGNSIEDLKSLCPGAIVLEGLAVHGSDVSDAQTEITAWLKRIAAN